MHLRLLRGRPDAELELARKLGAPDRALDQLRRGEAKLTHKPKLAALAAGAATMGGLALHLGDGFVIVPALQGAALGQGGVYARNLPSPGTFVINPALFAQRTSKNIKTYAAQAHPGMGGQLAFRVDAVGIVSRAILCFEGTYTSAATQATLTRQFPWNLAKQVVVSANGINQLIAVDGLDLRAFMRVRRAKWWATRTEAFTNPTATNNAPHRLFWELPLAYDESLVGGIFAQTEETYLNVAVTVAANADLFSANPGAYTLSQWKLVVEYYSIPTIDAKEGRALVLPDITQLHGIIAREDPLGAVGDMVSPLTRTGGILLRVLQRIDNADAGSLDPVASVTSHRFRYGGNVVPIDAPGSVVRFTNEQDYGDSILPTADVVSGGAAPNYLVDDFVIDNPLRDAIHLAGITEAQVINTIAAGTTINAGAKQRTTQESMVAG